MDEAEIAALVRRVEETTWPLEDWHHRQHLAIATWYLARHPKDEAVRRMRETVRRFNAAKGIPLARDRGYHDTLTVFWMEMLARHAGDGPVPDRVRKAFELFSDKRLPRRFYSRDLMMSWEARLRWYEPDLRPLDGPLDDEPPVPFEGVAEQFLARHRDRAPLAPAYDRFAELVGKGALALDVGCGPGFDAPELERRGLRVVGSDRAADMLRVAAERFPGPRVRADLRRLPFARVAGGIWANASLLHVPRPLVPDALDGLGRVLRAGGTLFLSLREGDGERWSVGPDGPAHPARFTFWRPKELDACLLGAGWGVLDGWDSDTWLVRFCRPSR